MFRFTESRLIFTFDDSWRVLFWDRHLAYTSGLGRQQGTAAVDFFALFGSCPYFIEVKNFCDYRIYNKDRLSSGELADEVARKVRDTLAGSVWALGRECADRDLERIVQCCFGAREKLRVVLWLEEDLQPRPADRSALAERIKSRLNWLNPHVLVLSRKDIPLAGLTVQAAPESA